jgi:lipopolysaccharide export system permease protein
MKTNSKDKEMELVLMPRILDRYVAREFLQSYLIAILVVLSLRIILDLFMQLDEFVEKGDDQLKPGMFTVIGYIFNFYGPKLFEYFRDFSGTIIILAAAFSLARMMRQNELTAVLASGVSLKRVIAPIVFLSFILNIFMVMDQEVVLPRWADKLVRKSDEMKKLREVSIWLLPDEIKALGYDPRYKLNERLSGEARKNALFSAGLFDPQEKKVYDLMVLLRRDAKVMGKITADQAIWDEGKQAWFLTNGQYYNFEMDPEQADSLPGVVPIQYYKSVLTADYLWLQRNSSFKSLMSYGELTSLLRRGLKTADRKEAISERHFRFTDPIINMVMLLLGLPMLVSRERRNTKTAIFLAILGAGGCFVTTFSCKLLGGGMINPLLAAWIPIIVFLPISIISLDGLKT